MRESVDGDGGPEGPGGVRVRADRDATAPLTVVRGSEGVVVLVHADAAPEAVLGDGRVLLASEELVVVERWLRGRPRGGAAGRAA